MVKANQQPVALKVVSDVYFMKSKRLTVWMLVGSEWDKHWETIRRSVLSYITVVVLLDTTCMGRKICYEPHCRLQPIEPTCYK